MVTLLIYYSILRTDKYIPEGILLYSRNLGTKVFHGDDGKGQSH